ncbi:MAG: TonB-dependent receptor [Ignavibacteriales bacterium]|nr:TonB-dependent receptor [Ignavibacteriales bacterium]
MNKFNQHHTLLFFILFIIMAIVPLTGQEKGKADSLQFIMDEFTIIGTRTTEKIIDIPYSVFRVDKKELAFGRKVSAKDVLADVPGLFLQSRYGNQDLRISIRGFGTRSNSGIRGVRILQDGIPESEPDGETVIDAVDLNSLGGVEVVKGNLSSLYANAAGGVINFVSDLYFPSNYVTLQNQVGKYGYRQNGFRLGLKNNDNRLLLTYNYRNLDGYREHSTENRHLVNAIYEMYLPKATLTILGNFVEGKLTLPGSLTRAEFESDPFQANQFAEQYNFKRNTKKGRLAVRYKLGLDNANNNEIEITGYGSVKELEMANSQFYTYSTRYSLGSLIRYTNKSEIFNRSNIITCGMEYAYQGGPITEFQNIYGQRGTSVEGEYVSSLGNLGFYFLNHINIIPEKFDFFLSGRYDRNVFNRDVFNPYRYTDSTIKFEKFVPKIAFNYKLTPVIAIYTSYGIGYDFPALSELANTPFSSNIKYSMNPDLVPQKSSNFELGIKSKVVDKQREFMRKLSVELTYFNYLIDQEIVPFAFNQNIYYRNAAKTNRTGLEFGFMSEPVEGIELVINYTITKFTYDTYKAEIYTPSGTVSEDYAGKYVPSVPTNILNFILNYEFEVSEEFSGLLQWDCDYIAAMYVDDRNSEKTNPYFYGNVMCGINYATERYGLIFYAGAGNIFDKRYSGFVNINEANKMFYETGEPSTFYSGLNLTYKF